MDELNISDDMSFDEWFDLFMDNVKRLGYSGTVDKYSFESEYEDGQTPETSAEEFVREMTE